MWSVPTGVLHFMPMIWFHFTWLIILLKETSEPGLRYMHCNRCKLQKPNWKLTIQPWASEQTSLIKVFNALLLHNLQTMFPCYGWIWWKNSGFAFSSLKASEGQTCTDFLNPHVVLNWMRTLLAHLHNSSGKSELNFNTHLPVFMHSHWFSVMQPRWYPCNL
jgi:hypothetical protein